MALAVPSAAHAEPKVVGRIYVPTISPVDADQTVTVTARLTLGAECSPDETGESCGFFPSVASVREGEPCVPGVTAASWVGEKVTAPPGQSKIILAGFSATWKESPGVVAEAKTACVFAESPHQFVTLINYTVPPLPAPTPTPTPDPTPQGKPAVRFGISYAVKARKRETRFSRLSLKRVPSGATIRVTCRGGCPRRSVTLRPRSSTVALKAFRNRALRPGAKLTVTVTKPGATGMVKVVTIRSRKAPTIVTRTAP